MKQSITFFRQACILLLLAGLSACSGVDAGSLKAEIEETRAAIDDELTALNSVKMEQKSMLDGLKEDLKWEYSEEFEKLVKQYESEFSRLKENMDELGEIYDALGGYAEKLGGLPLEYSPGLVKEMFEEKAEHVEELVADIENIQDTLYDLTDQIDNL